MINEDIIMATNLKLSASNATSQGWEFALYQKQPKELGLQDVAWKVLKLSQPEPKPTTGYIPWSLDFQVTIPQSSDGNIYEGGISMNAREGYNYEAYTDKGFVQIREVGQGTKGFINFKNSTKTKQNLGINLSGTLLAMQGDVAGGVRAQFKITPTYYLGLFNNLKEGSFVTSDAAVGPVEIQFPPGMTTVSVEALIQDGTDVLSAPKYSTQ